MLPAHLTAERDVFLAAVGESPDDDVPRLVLADWLQENGQEQRAEFIRVQVALAQIPRERADRFNEDTDWSLCETESGISATWCPNCGDCSCPDPADLNHPDCPLHSAESLHCCLTDIEYREATLRRRERELQAEWVGLCGVISGGPTFRVKGLSRPYHGEGLAVCWRPADDYRGMRSGWRIEGEPERGFIYRVRGPWELIRDHLPAMLDCPDVMLTRAELTDLPDVAVQPIGRWVV